MEPFCAFFSSIKKMQLTDVKAAGPRKTATSGTFRVNYGSSSSKMVASIKHEEIIGISVLTKMDLHMWRKGIKVSRMEKCWEWNGKISGNQQYDMWTCLKIEDTPSIKLSQCSCGKCCVTNGFWGSQRFQADPYRICACKGLIDPRSNWILPLDINLYEGIWDPQMIQIE